MTSPTNTNAEIVETIRSADAMSPGWLTGLETVETVAAAWSTACNGNAADVARWITAGAFDPDRVAQLRAAGVASGHLLTHSSHDGTASTGSDVRTYIDPDTEQLLAYAHSNRDVTTAEVIEILAKHGAA